MYFSKKKERQMVKMYPTTDDADIARILGVPLFLIKRKAEELGLEKQEQIELTSKQINVLVRLYPTIPNWKFAELFGKSKMEIEHTAYRLGIAKKSSFWANITNTTEQVELVKKWSDMYDRSVHGSSKGNFVLGLILDHMYPMYRKFDEHPIGGLRIDWFVPELQVAFEYHGIQHEEFNDFHYETKDDFERAQKRDIEKSYMCESMGIALVHFRHDEELSFGLVSAKIREVL